MARTSKKKELSVLDKKGYSDKKIFSVGIYARLSVDHHEEKKESIEMQIEIAEKFIEMQPDFVLYDCYSDLGKTGTNFAREEFNRLMKDVRLRMVNCIVVKDFSRLGRNYIETGNYIQKIFPFLGVRFISITDQFDSFSNENDEWSMSLKNLVNEMYAKDIAIKVKSSKRIQWKKGSYMGGMAPYGYRAEWVGDKKCLLLEETSNIVKEIFEYYDSGNSIKEIVRCLYKRQIHRPTEYHQYGHIFYQEGEELKEWCRTTIRMLLCNPVYMGHLVQGMVCNKDFACNTRHHIKKEDWSLKEHTHESIISEEQFFRVAERFEKQTMNSKQNGCSQIIQKKEDLFEGVLFCGVCGSRMQRISSTKQLKSGNRVKNYSYICRSGNRIDECPCGRHSISFHIIIKLVRVALKHEFFLTGQKPKTLVEKSKEEAECQKQKLQKSCNSIEKSLKKKTKKSSEQYLKYRKGDISKEEFQSWKLKNEKEIQQLNLKLQEENYKLQEVDYNMTKQSRFIRTLLKFNEELELDKELLNSLIQKINVYPDKRVEIIFFFQEKYFVKTRKEKN